jgi:putative membrane protein
MDPMDDPSIDSLRLAYERTALAWVRTSLALIGFGFTIDKFFEVESRKAGAGVDWQPHVIGITMIAFGLIALLLFVCELGQFRKRYPRVPWSVAGVVAGLIGILGIMALISAILG